MLHASSSSDLLAQLAALYAKDAGQTAGRPTQERERATITQWLAAVASADQVAFPLILRHRDRPDFELETPSGTIGIEVSNVIPEDLAEGYALLKREAPGAFIELSHFRPKRGHIGKKELKRLIAATELTGEGWKDDELEQDWSALVCDSYLKKMHKAQCSDVTWYQSNTLVLHDDTPCIGVREDVGMALLLEMLAIVPHLEREYDHMDIARSNSVLRIHAHGKRWSRMAIPDLAGTV